MFGKNNTYMRKRKNGEKLTQYGIRKLGVGVASIAVAAGILLGQGLTVQADELSLGEASLTSGGSDASSDTSEGDLNTSTPPQEAPEDILVEKPANLPKQVEPANLNPALLAKVQAAISAAEEAVSQVQTSLLAAKADQIITNQERESLLALISQAQSTKNTALEAVNALDEGPEKAELSARLDALQVAEAPALTSDTSKDDKTKVEDSSKEDNKEVAKEETAETHHQMGEKSRVNEVQDSLMAANNTSESAHNTFPTRTNLKTDAAKAQLTSNLSPNARLSSPRYMEETAGTAPTENKRSRRARRSLSSEASLRNVADSTREVGGANESGTAHKIDTSKKPLRKFALGDERNIYAEDYRVKVKNDNIGDYFHILGKSNDPNYNPINYDPATGIVKLTDDDRSQIGQLNLMYPLDASKSFTFKGKVNLGDKYETHGNGGDGVSFVFNSDPTRDTGKEGAGLALAGLKNSFGFKLDTYHNTSKPSDRQIERYTYQ